MHKIAYPYIPPDREIKYVPADNPFMRDAREYAQANALDERQKIGAAIVKNGEVVGRGANGSDYHKTHGCERVRRGIPTGEQYELCEGCHPKNHAEPRALADAKKNGHNLRGADLYLWGHWWACEPCWDAMIGAGIKNVYLVEGSGRLFNKANPDNIIEKQFT